MLEVTYSFLLARSSHLAQGHREVPQAHLGAQAQGGQLGDRLSDDCTHEQEGGPTLSFLCSRAPSKQVLAVSQSYRARLTITITTSITTTNNTRNPTCFIM